MSLSAIPKSLRHRIYQRDKGQCQYCLLAQVGQGGVFHIDHIIPRASGGQTDESNLALQCPYCSLHKSDRTGGIDPLTADQSPLFHPLQLRWADHFAMDSTGTCNGLTAIGRVTVQALRMNDPLPRIARALQISLGLLKVSS